MRTRRRIAISLPTSSMQVIEIILLKFNIFKTVPVNRVNYHTRHAPSNIRYQQPFGLDILHDCTFSAFPGAAIGTNTRISLRTIE